MDKKNEEFEEKPLRPNNVVHEPVPEDNDEYCHCLRPDILELFKNKKYADYKEQLDLISSVDPHVNNSDGYTIDRSNGRILLSNANAKYPGAFQVSPFIVNYKEKREDGSFDADFAIADAAAIMCNDGFHNVAIGTDGVMYDLGEVNHACFIGDPDGKSNGIYIPLNAGNNAVIDGCFMLHSIYASSNKDGDKYLNIRHMLDQKECK